ncbi:uncharacterized protein LOC120835991 isoform X2 [Ixodes scapularis]|uniref:uncharacterized protein LOC120835991 isoform X2 n=1 Tax=Ixodes scapularis TaxID=6945 RepID=UPI001C392540|nr:uncharacterized protein LOC120835991 isoform X2 [Ixodes scapularis]
MAKWKQKKRTAEYDRARRAREVEYDRARRARETPEERERRLARNRIAQRVRSATEEGRMKRRESCRRSYYKKKQSRQYAQNNATALSKTSGPKRRTILFDQPSHAAAHPDYVPNLLNEPAPDLRVLMCIRRALQREPPVAIGTSETQPSEALQPYSSGTQGSRSETEAAGQEKSSSSLSSINKLARKFEKDQAEVAKAGLPSFTDAHTEYVQSLPNEPEPDLRMLMCYRRALRREAPAASQIQLSAALQPHNSKAQGSSFAFTDLIGSSNKTEAASQDSSSSLNELARRLEEDHTEEAEAGAEDADQPTKEDPSAEPQVSPETLRHVKDNLQRHLLKLKKKRKKR